MPPVARTLVPSVITKAEATLINCARLYETYKEQYGTDKIAISVKGATLHTFGHSTHTHLVHLPRTNTFVAQHCPLGYEHFEVRVEYKLDHLDPKELKTRAEFLIELHDIWQSMWLTLPEDRRKTTGVVFTQAQELLTSTYEARELGNQDYLEVTQSDPNLS
jgi:hypothetical protein